MEIGSHGLNGPYASTIQEVDLEIVAALCLNMEVRIVQETILKLSHVCPLLMEHGQIGQDCLQVHAQLLVVMKA